MLFKRKPGTDPNAATWDDARKGKWLPESILNSPDEKTMRLTFVDAQKQPLPVLFMRYAETAFRTKITKATNATLLIDVVTMFPFPTPFAFVMPVIFDDNDDPFWSFLHLTLFPLKSVYGVQHVYFPGSDPLAPRRLLESCAEQKKCGLVILNHSHEVLKAEIVSLNQWDSERPKEIIELMKFLDSRNVTIDFIESQAATNVFSNYSCFQIERPDGKVFFLPLNRWPHISDTYIYPIRVAHGRLIDRRVQSTPTKSTSFDLFISHAHSDAAFARALRNWLLAVWPTLKIFISDAEDRSEFDSNPAYFLERAQASKLMLFLVSDISIKRRIVITEVGLQAGRPILPVLIGGVSRADLEDYAADQLFVSIDASRAVDLTNDKGWTDLGNEVARFCGLALPKRFNDPPAIKRTITSADDNRDPNAAYVAWWANVVHKVLRRQTEDEAASKLELILDAASGTKIPESTIKIMKTFDVHSKLIVFLMHSEDEMFWRYVVGQLPALLTPKLFNTALIHVDNFSGPRAEHARLKRLTLFLHEAIASQQSGAQTP